jgi:protein phosphatase PTC1
MLIIVQLWDVCSDQEAVDHVRSTKDPQVASKMLVGHALARFSTDNLSCMVVRFDTKAVQQAVAQQTDLIGVEGDSPSKKGSVTESEAIVAEAQQKIRISEGESQSPSRVVEELNTGAAPGPKLNPEG